jgi:hypothetical protein
MQGDVPGVNYDCSNIVFGNACVVTVARCQLTDTDALTWVGSRKPAPMRSLRVETRTIIEGGESCHVAAAASPHTRNRAFIWLRAVAFTGAPAGPWLFDSLENAEEGNSSPRHAQNSAA